MTTDEYIRQRFIKNNHPKYHKYMDEWIKGITLQQRRYFNIEKIRLGL